MKNQKGFTLLETVVALGILAIGITGLFVILQDIERNFGFAKGYIASAYLNQEAVEYIRNIKDSNIYEPNLGATYDTGILDGSSDPFYFEIDSGAPDILSQMIAISNSIDSNCFTTQDKVKDCYNSNNIREMKIRDSFPYYYYGTDSNPSTNMKRIVKVQKVTGNDGNNVNDYQAIRVESRTFFKIRDNVYMHKVIHYMYDRK
jgi:prepilin-type N-terminal cleavage/methylation domain-containing protein